MTRVEKLLKARGWRAIGRRAYEALAKGKDHKYIKRVPYTKKNGKRGYKYYYKETLHRLSRLGGEDTIKVGSSFQLKDGDERGHFHVKAIDGDRVTLEHDETGKVEVMTRIKLAARLEEEHGSAHTQARGEQATKRKERVRRNYQAAKDAGSRAHMERWKREGAQLGLDLDPAPKGDDDDKSAQGGGDALVSVRPGDLDRKRLVAAYNGVSWTPEKRADQMIAEYVEYMGSFEQKARGWATDENRADLKARMEAYKQGYIKHLMAWMDAKSRTVSPMITGRSNFPTGRNNDRMDTEDKRRQEFGDWDDAQRKRLRRDFDPKERAKAPISSDQNDAVARLQSKLDGARKAQEMMVAANKIVKRKKGDLESKVQELMGLGIKEPMARKLFEKDFAGRIGFADYALSNNRQEIKRLEGRLSELGRERSTQAAPDMEFDGGTVVDNVGLNRVQIVFDGKPDEAMRAKLKANGFKWSPREGAWQRMRNDAGRRAVVAVVGVNMQGET